MSDRSETQEKDGYNPGYAVFVLAMFIGLLVNVAADIIYERFLRSTELGQDLVLGLTGICFVGLMYAYHTRLHKPLAKFLAEFE